MRGYGQSQPSHTAEATLLGNCACSEVVAIQDKVVPSRCLCLGAAAPYFVTESWHTFFLLSSLESQLWVSGSFVRTSWLCQSRALCRGWLCFPETSLQREFDLGAGHGLEDQNCWEVVRLERTSSRVTESSCPGPCPDGFDYLQEWKCHHLSAQPVPNTLFLLQLKTLFPCIS